MKTDLKTIHEEHSDEEQNTTESVETTAAPQPVVLSDEQKKCVDAVIQGPPDENLLIIGKAGVGKSTTTRAICEEADKLAKNFYRCAPTGVAALNIGGMTVHRLISILSRNPGSLIDFILIDEASMLRADLFDQLNDALRSNQMRTEPFGGVKIVLVGDPGQLPPVVKEKAEQEMIEENYYSPYFFSSACYARGTWKIIELTQVFRQVDPRYPRMLNLVREGKHEKPIAFLNKFRRTTQPRGMILASTNKDAEAINYQELKKLGGQSTIFRAEIMGNISPNEFPVAQTIELKVGAKVMIVKNIYTGSKDSGYRLELVNGDRGEVTQINPVVIDEDGNPVSSEGIEIFCDRTQKHHLITAGNGVWEKEEKIYNRSTKRLESNVVARFVQLPVRLGWAITIHKSQGATLEELTIDVRRPLFATGQAYVALSRGVSLEKLWILGIMRASDIKVCPHVLSFLHDSKSGVGIKPGSYFEDRENELAAKTDPQITRMQADENFDEMPVEEQESSQ